MSIFHHSMTTFGYITIAIVEDIYTQNVLTVSPGMFCTTKMKKTDTAVVNLAAEII